MGVENLFLMLRIKEKEKEQNCGDGPPFWVYSIFGVQAESRVEGFAALCLVMTLPHPMLSHLSCLIPPPRPYGTLTHKPVPPSLSTQKTREGWVSHAVKDHGAVGTGCSCPGGEVIGSGKESTAASDDVHWDGARPEQPRGHCQGDMHGPQCGHDVSWADAPGKKLTAARVVVVIVSLGAEDDLNSLY